MLKISWVLKTLVVRMNNEVFALQQKMENGNIYFSVLMLAHREKCDRFKMTLEIQNNNSKTAFSAQFNPVPVEMEASDEAIFMVQKQRFAKMVTTDGDRIRYKLELKVSEKRANED